MFTGYAKINGRLKRIRINNQINASELRVVDDKGENLGVLKTMDALRIAKERELDLIEIAPTAKPPVAKIMDYGKFQYQEKKREKEAKKKVHETETKAIQLGIGTSQHDLELKSKKASEFLKEGHRIKISLILKGRAKYMDREFIKERLNRILNLITEDYRVAQEAKKGPRGIIMVIEHSK
ncbi:MAG TPA: translation initiation factor IF-3 [Candidatus Campbellbacteria bacterium]|nr:translation initiation factor IF-3 [Candidatus Campbellbacteria bacterium]